MWRRSQQVKRPHPSNNYIHAGSECTSDHLKVFAKSKPIQVFSGSKSVRAFLAALDLAQFITSPHKK
jgi:hypothetical protein